MDNTENKKNHHWIDFLSEEDISFIKRFILASGSLKELARVYGITYPTVRLRLDRLIERIKILDSIQPMSRFERMLRAHYAERRIDSQTFKSLLAAYQSDLES